MVKLIIHTTLLIHQIFTNFSVCTVLKRIADKLSKNCAEIIGDRPRQPAEEILSIKRGF